MLGATNSGGGGIGGTGGSNGPHSMDHHQWGSTTATVSPSPQDGLVKPLPSSSSADQQHQPPPLPAKIQRNPLAYSHQNSSITNPSHSSDVGQHSKSSSQSTNCSNSKASTTSPGNLFSANSYKFKSGVSYSGNTNVVTAPTTTTSAPLLHTSTSSRTPDSSYSSSFGGSGGGGGGGLKFSYESQPGSGGGGVAVVTTASTLLTPSPSPSMSQIGGGTTIAPNIIGAQPIVKDSPPSSPNSEAGSSRKRTRKHEISQKDLKIFQNGIHATHMLGNQLNPASSVAQKMSDQLHMEIEAHSVYSGQPVDNGQPLVGPPFPGKQQQLSSNSIKATSQGPPSLSSMLSGSATATAAGGAPQSLEQLLERQWEQGSQFLMEQAQHFDSEYF